LSCPSGKCWEKAGESGGRKKKERREGQDALLEIKGEKIWGCVYAPAGAKREKEGDGEIGKARGKRVGAGK